MSAARIPVDLLNPGQVFACMGFLEIAHALFGDAEAGFDWEQSGPSWFQLRSGASENPIRAVLGFLSTAKLLKIEPADSSRTFPSRSVDPFTPPLALEADRTRVFLSHWCDDSSRNSFKLFAGQQKSGSIAEQMLAEIRRLYETHGNLADDPFSFTCPLGGSTFKFDPRKSWTAIDAGYSPDEQQHEVVASPLVELLAALGLEHARPYEVKPRLVRYAVWRGFLPPILARPALAGANLGLPLRRFQFALEMSGKNKIVTFAEEET